MTETRSAVDGVAASAADAVAGPATPAARNAAVATVATLRACRGSPPHVTPRERGACAPPLVLLSTTCTSVCWLRCLARGASAPQSDNWMDSIEGARKVHPSGLPGRGSRTTGTSGSAEVRDEGCPTIRHEAWSPGKLNDREPLRCVKSV